MPEAAAPVAVYRFANFQLAPARELLLDGDQPVRVGSRALRVLTTLVERAGELISKDELIAEAWPNLYVDEANLKVQVSALRRLLGERHGPLIANIPGRGYRFVGGVSREDLLTEAASGRPTPANDLPALLTRVIGREDAVADVRGLLAEHRLVTLTGAGGIGKTTLAIAAATAHGARAAGRGLGPAEAGAVFVDLAAVAGPDLVAGAVASALGVRAGGEDPVGQAVAQIGGQAMLLVIDNCEHVVSQAAELAETLLGQSAGLKILATSRAPLRARGEQVYRLGPLEFPADGAVLDAAAAMAFPAVGLFVERARSAAHGLGFGEADVAPVAQICRRLDGLPLALELAAAQIHGLGFANLAARLDDRLALLTRGWRTALPRQQTLRATLDWSYELLSPREQSLFASLGIFAGVFTFEAAAAVCEAEGAAADLFAELAGLAEKSMLVIDARGEALRYGLLESPKAYALERLRAEGSYDATAARRARAMLDLAARARQQWTHRDARAWQQTHRHALADIRASLEWAFAPDSEGVGDVELGAALLLETAQLWIGLGLLPEFFRHAERALAALAARDGCEALQLGLSSAVGHAIYQMGANPTLTPTMTGAFESALALASQLGDTRQQVRALYSQCVGCLGVGDYHEVIPLADRFLEAGRGLPDARAERLHTEACGVAAMMMGRYADARRHLDLCLADPTLGDRAGSHEGFDFDPLVTAKNMEARVLWMTGYPDQALAVLRDLVEDVLSLGHLPSYLNALQGTVMNIPIWAGDAAFHADQLERYVAFGQAHNLDFRGLWRTVIDLGWRSTVEQWSYAQARQALADVGKPFNVYGNEMWAAYHPGFVLPEMVERVREGKSGWCAPEVLRGLGEGRLDAGDRAGARAAFEEALALAESQGARAWALRAAISLCRLDSGTGRGRDVLAEVHGRYTEGFGVHDLKIAAGLLQA